MSKKSKIAIPLLALVCAVVIAACGQTGGAGGIAGMLQHLKPLAERCDGPLTGVAEIDGSVTGRGDETLNEDRLQAVHHLADQAAACGGVMKVALFGRSEAEDATLGEAEFPTSSGTETARLIAANKVEGELLAEVEESLPRALKEVHPDGTDVLSVFDLAREFTRQHPTGQLYLQLDSDGLNTVEPVVMNSPAFTPTVAHNAAEHVVLPNLAGAHVEILGLGQTSGPRRPSTEKVKALRTFYELACHKQMHAASCIATSETEG